MSNTKKVYTAFALIFLVGFLAVYAYIRFFLNHQLSTVETTVQVPLMNFSTLL